MAWTSAACRASRFASPIDQSLRLHAVGDAGRKAARRLFHVRDLTMVDGPSGSDARSSSRRSEQASDITAADGSWSERIASSRRPSSIGPSSARIWRIRRRSGTGTGRGPDQADVRAAGFGPQILGGDQELLEAEFAQRDLEKTFILKIANAARGHHVEEEPAVAAGYDDGLGLYLRGPNRRRRKVRDRA
jgi:hypothetical protein